MSDSSKLNTENSQTGQRIKAVKYIAPVERVSESANVVDHKNNIHSKSQSNGAPWWYSQFNLMLIVFALLGMTVLLFITLTPSPTASIAGSEASSNSDLIASNVNPATDAAAPWDQSRRAQARVDAQEILSNLLDSKKDLEDKEVQIWAPNEYQQAIREAELGDDFYKLQDYQQALNSYQSAVDKLDNLYQQIPIYVQNKIVLGQKALDQGKSQLAHEAFSSALMIEPNNIAAMNGLNRAEIIDQVLQLSQAAQLEQQLFSQQDDLELLLSAEKKLEQALTLDKENKNVIIQLENIVNLQKDKQYRDAMTVGFAALFNNNYNVANSSFATALKLNPGDETANLAYKQSLASNKTSSLQSLLESARDFESNENWQNALSNYQEVLSRDPNQVQARLGEIRSSARSNLDQQLKNVLSDTLALSKSNNKEEALKLLADAQSLRSSGPKLQTQIEQLENALTMLEATIKVQIASDDLTEISLSKEGASQIQLGRFSNKNLALKPGRYVLTGARFGFRDKREEIELRPGSAELHYFDLRCDQPIGMVSQEGVDDPA